MDDAGCVGIMDIVNVPPSRGSLERGGGRPGMVAGGLRLYEVSLELQSQ